MDNSCQIPGGVEEVHLAAIGVEHAQHLEGAAGLAAGVFGRGIALAEQGRAQRFGQRGRAGGREAGPAGVLAEVRQRSAAGGGRAGRRIGAASAVGISGLAWVAGASGAEEQGAGGDQQGT
jgi:hypothetical protein